MNDCKYRNLDGMCYRVSQVTKNTEDEFFCTLGMPCLYGIIKLGKHFNLLENVDYKPQGAHDETSE